MIEYILDDGACEEDVPSLEQGIRMWQPCIRMSLSHLEGRGGESAHMVMKPVRKVYAMSNCSISLDRFHFLDLIRREDE